MVVLTSIDSRNKTNTKISKTITNEALIKAMYIVDNIKIIKTARVVTMLAPGHFQLDYFVRIVLFHNILTHPVYV